MKTFILPGMGATGAMYPGPWTRLPEATFIEWPLDDRSETIPELAATLIEKFGITSSDRVIGSSFGGMVGCEISNLITLKKVILFGSASHPSEIRKPLRFLHPLIKLTPLKLIHRLGTHSSHLPLSMFSKTDPTFTRRMTLAVFQWQGDQGRSPLIRVHGIKDPVIRPHQTAHLINGGHLIATTHAQECLKYLPST